MIFSGYYGSFQYDAMGRIVVSDGAGRLSLSAELNRLRKLEKEVVRQSRKVSDLLELCEYWEKEATGTPGMHKFNRMGSRFLNRDGSVQDKERDIRELEKEVARLECERDKWSTMAGEKMMRHHTAQNAREREYAEAKQSYLARKAEMAAGGYHRANLNLF
jgi:hypothetical protein